MPKVIGVDLQGSAFHPFNSQKVLCHSRRMEAAVNERYLPPVVMNLDVTGRCQYRCGHCHHRGKQVRGPDLPDLSERLARTLPYFLRHWRVDGVGVDACCVVGSRGDPLLYPGLPSLLQKLHFAGVEVGVVTNGYGMMPKLQRSLEHYAKFVGFSVDAGTKKTYDEIKNCPDDAWDRVLKSVRSLADAVGWLGLRNDVGWKFLVLPENQNEIVESCRLAKELGCRYVQIRPADLPEERRREIAPLVVETQIKVAIEQLEVPGEFEIVGVRHKFDPNFRAVLPDHCWLTPLTVTVTSDGKAYACVDRRCDESTMIADCGRFGWASLSDRWGSAAHLEIVHDVINRCGQGPDCGIRCSNYGYDEYFRNYFVEDNVDWRLV